MAFKKRKKIAGYLVMLETFQGPYVTTGKNALAAILAILSHYGLRYSNERFKIKEVKCLTACSYN